MAKKAKQPKSSKLKGVHRAVVHLAFNREDSTFAHAQVTFDKVELGDYGGGEKEWTETVFSVKFQSHRLDGPDALGYSPTIYEGNRADPLFDLTGRAMSSFYGGQLDSTRAYAFHGGNKLRLLGRYFDQIRKALDADEGAIRKSSFCELTTYLRALEALGVELKFTLWMGRQRVIEGAMGLAGYAEALAATSLEKGRGAAFVNQHLAVRAAEEAKRRQAEAVAWVVKRLEEKAAAESQA
jgi:hypothetical protein